MKSNDLKNPTKEKVLANMQQALKDNNPEAYSEAFEQMMQITANEIRAEYEQRLQEVDSQILSARGVRQLTSEERKYWQKFSEAAGSGNPKQAVADMGLALPETTINAVFEDLQTNHPLLSKINFQHSGGATRIIMATNGYQRAQWGKLCAEVVEEATAGLVVMESMLLKLTAFLLVCKPMLELGPEWLDRFARGVLYEMLANGMEYGFVAGSGKDEPIGMIRDVSDEVSTTGGVYPKKAAVLLPDLEPQTLGNLLAQLAVDPSGKVRVVRDVIMVVNPVDYFVKIFPATTQKCPDGTYKNNILPYPMDVIQSAAVDIGEAVLGIGYRYGATAGTSPEGKIEYSDHYRFAEDERAYLVRAYANGRPMDNNAFIRLDISKLKPATYKVELVDAADPSTNADLADLTIGGKALSPEFDATTTTYTFATTNSSNTVKATPADAGAQAEVKVGDNVIGNGTAATWAAGENQVTVTVTAQDGTTAKVYKVTVTKS